MLFNSYVFIFAFLPFVLLGFFLIKSLGNKYLLEGWLVLSSLFFYSWWNIYFLPLLLVSVIVNYSAGRLIATSESSARVKMFLVLGVVFNLGLLGYFKYANFFLENMRWALGDISANVMLPLAISFFTFQQIAYLVDCKVYNKHESNFITYSLFVSFFPQLIAGPIVHHKQIIPQFSNMLEKINWYFVASGLVFICVGLFKKVVVADSLGLGMVDPVFLATQQATFYSAWMAAIGYTFQIYFDFSGYCDIATGLALLFGIVLPINFYSPYKSTSIIEFWRRWHITLSAFLRDYLYIPLGGNRKGVSRRYINLMVTMLLGGLWHGAAWGFIVWGGMHGIFLIVNYGWRALCAKQPKLSFFMPWFFAGIITFLMVTFGLVVFRSSTINDAFSLYLAMFNMTDILSFDFSQIKNIIVLFIVGVVCFSFPNLWQFTGLEANQTHDFKSKCLFSWSLSTAWALIFVTLFILSIVLMSRQSEFIYFQF